VPDDLLERDEEAPLADLHEAGERLGDLHAREALVTGVRIGREDRERERESGDVRERLSGPDREGCQHRVDLALEVLLEPLQLLVGAILDTADDDPLVGEAGS
jgi:hypothetical protein